MPGRNQRLIPTGVLGLALFAFFPWSCQRRPPTAVPPPPDYFAAAERYFVAGDYGNAAQAYETFLASSRSPTNRDKALFRLGLLHAFPESPVRNIPQAINMLQQVVSQFPQSPYRPEAEFLLRLQAEVDRLSASVGQRDEQVKILAEESERLKQAGSEREERIRGLTQELERLKQIDMERRPTRPPR